MNKGNNNNNNNNSNNNDNDDDNNNNNNNNFRYPQGVIASVVFYKYICNQLVDTIVLVDLSKSHEILNSKKYVDPTL